MGRHNGSWSKFHPQLNDHEKTARAAAVLREGGVAPEYAAPVVIVALLRLAAWALGDGDTGETTTLTDGRLAGIAWPEAVESKKAPLAVPARAGNLLRRALREAGFLDHDDRAEWIHDFVEVYLEVINRRRKARRLPAVDPEFLRNNRRGKSSISPELFRLCHVPGGSGSGSGSGSPPTPRGGGGAIQPPPGHPAADAVRPGPPRSGHPEPPPTDTPAATHPDPLVARLTARLRWHNPATVADVVAELRREGFTDPDLAARIESTPDGRQPPWSWARAVRTAAGTRPSALTDAERAELRRSVERWVGLAHDAERAGKPADAANAWNSVRLRAAQLGLDAVAEFGAPPLPSSEPAA